LIYNAAISKWINATISAGITTLSALPGCTITSPSTTQVLQYNSSGEWVNATLGSSSALSTLNDVSITTLSTNQILMYSTVSGKWINTTIPNISLASLSDVVDTSVANNDIMQHSSSLSKWVSSGSVNSSIVSMQATITANTTSMNSIKSSSNIIYNTPLVGQNSTHTISMSDATYPYITSIEGTYAVRVTHEAYDYAFVASFQTSFIKGLVPYGLNPGTLTNTTANQLVIFYFNAYTTLNNIALFSPTPNPKSGGMIVNSYKIYGSNIAHTDGTRFANIIILVPELFYCGQVQF
jgi:hypothetical protein